MITRNVIQKHLKSLPGPKRGEQLFAGTTYPRTWGEYVGQAEAVGYLRASAMSAKMRGERLEHVLIATGAAGVGKTALARLVCAEMEVGMVEVQGAISEAEAVRIFASMSDGDILFWDEIHQAIGAGRAKAEWLLPVLQDGVMISARGVTPIPDITIIGATTDVQKLPETIISRFVVKPALEEYTDDEARAIAQVTARKVWQGLTALPIPNDQTCAVVARAGNNNPRVITALLKTLRDSACSGNALVTPDGTYSTDAMFRWSGVTPDGLDKLAQDYLEVLHVQFGGKAGEKTIAAALNEPTPPRHTEKLLTRRGWLRVAPGGRELTTEGMERAHQVLVDRGYDI